MSHTFALTIPTLHPDDVRGIPNSAYEFRCAYGDSIDAENSIELTIRSQGNLYMKRSVTLDSTDLHLIDRALTIGVYLDVDREESALLDECDCLEMDNDGSIEAVNAWMTAQNDLVAHYRALLLEQIPGLSVGQTYLLARHTGVTRDVDTHNHAEALAAYLVFLTRNTRIAREAY